MTEKNSLREKIGIVSDNIYDQKLKREEAIEQIMSLIESDRKSWLESILPRKSSMMDLQGDSNRPDIKATAVNSWNNCLTEIRRRGCLDEGG